MHKPNSCFFSLTAHSSRSHNPPPTLPPHITFFFDCCPPQHTHTLIFFSFSCLCCLLLLLSLSLCLSHPLSLSPPFCGWQSPWDCAHSWLENLKLCPNTSFQDLPREIPHGCFYTADLPFWLPLSPLNYSTVLLPKTPLPPSSPPQNSPATLPSSSLCWLLPCTQF